MVPSFVSIPFELRSHSVTGHPEHRVCALSIDLESWVHRQIRSTLKTNFKKELDKGYIEKATHFALKLLKQYHRRVTFFVVSEIFDWYPDLIRKIESHGHEIAYHTHTHRYVETKQDLFEELGRSKGFLEEFEPTGFRAPEGSIRTEHLEILADYGFEYDSSSYGNLNTSTIIHGVREIPISTLKFSDSPSRLNLPRNITKSLLCRELPLGSGFFMSALGPAARVLPGLLGFQNKIPVLFIHPWQIMINNTHLPTRENSIFKQTAILLYSRKCLGSLVYLLSHFQTIRLRDLAHEFPKVGNL